ncbi:MAG: EamA family transporter [Ktedonobacteraceae bacterium]|nr:EamA family transporter [Ktedonobacteraceae bacterium]
MTLLAVGFVLLSAVLHATWNLLAKRAQGDASFTWLYDVLALLIFFPAVFVFILFSHASFSAWAFVFIIVSGLLELAYFLLLQRGYRVGDLSLVYPLARGTGPLLTTVVAILVLREHPTPLALFGTGCVVGGVLLIAWRPQRLSERRSRLAVLYGILTGCCIAGYTLWDKEALSIGHLAPLILYYGTICVHVPVLTPFALHHWREVRFHWRVHRLEALGIAVLSAFSYVLVLTALVFTPVSYIAPAREISVLFGTLLGTRLLAEGETRRRLVAAGIIVVGILALAL